MSATSLQHKTIRPGSLMNYSYYHSVRRPMPAARTAKPRAPSLGRVWKRRLSLTAAVLAALIILPIIRSSTLPALSDSATKPPAITPTPKAAAGLPAATGLTKENQCAGNKLDKLVLISISQRHLWGCQGSQTVHDAPVITGMEMYDSTRTPVGTYSVQARQADTRLTGSDEAGSWDYPVKYWMPFLTNKHGVYGFHDATWRPGSDFGNVDPNSKNASHGCVELPLSDMQWLYNWASAGTRVTVKN